MAATEPVGRRRRARWQPAARSAVLWPLTLLTVAALAIDAYIHADLASSYDPISHDISQGDLFRIEAGLSSLAALLLVLTSSRLVWTFAAAVLASALGAILLYRYVDVGVLGPLPNMYEPLWFPEKTSAAIAEAVGTVTAIVGLVLAHRASHAQRAARAR
ncbi:hypothetical protein [Kitasatospora kifunensis]|uniref:Uncharacterized protein n=1 Tax=Kitasatospora kifunensis TaxID=58351 RepID=A0A7W7RBW9_KITKI|nr:hypothetical protein [Kitasatospora kifunensis]MBB4928556.1 hypothetical protein [Kitasatospora kifunensis]